MTTPFPFDGMLAFAFLSVLLLMGVGLRARVGFFQRFLVPSCLIGGVLGLVLMHTGVLGIDTATVEAVAYHFFNISFISVGLTRDDYGSEHQAKKQMIKGPAWMALMQGLTFPMQAVLGGLLVILLGWFGVQLFPTFGFLVPLGFNEGPGQALSIGKVWEGVGFADAATIGLTFAAVGYFFAFFIGVPLVNRGIRRGRAAFGPRQLPRDFLTGILNRQGTAESAGRLTIHSGNAETLAFQSALVGGVYGITYGIIQFLGGFLPADVARMLWGFFFFFGLGVALVVKWAMQRLKIQRLADAGVQRRITGFSVDFLIVATVAAIELKIVWEYLLPISLIALVNGVIDHGAGGLFWPAPLRLQSGAHRRHLRGRHRHGVLRPVAAAHRGSGLQNPCRLRACGDERVFSAGSRGVHGSGQRSPVVGVAPVGDHTGFCRYHGRRPDPDEADEGCSTGHPRR